MLQQPKRKNLGKRREEEEEKKNEEEEEAKVISRAAPPDGRQPKIDSYYVIYVCSIKKIVFLDLLIYCIFVKLCLWTRKDSFTLKVLKMELVFGWY